MFTTTTRIAATRVPKKYTEDVSKPIFDIRSWKTPYEMKKIARDVRVPYNKLKKNIFLLNNRFFWPGMYKRGYLEQLVSETSWKRKKEKPSELVAACLAHTMFFPHDSLLPSLPTLVLPLPPSHNTTSRRSFFATNSVSAFLSAQNKFHNETNKNVSNIIPIPTWSRTAKNTIGAEVKNTL